jgi:hypothetical protein
MSSAVVNGGGCSTRPWDIISSRSTALGNGNGYGYGNGWGSSKKTANAAANDLMKQVTREKHAREEKKEKRQEEKKAEEELAKARREETLACTVIAAAKSPPEYTPLPKDSPLFEMTKEELTEYVTGFLGLSGEEADNYVAQVKEQNDSFELLENETIFSDEEEAADHLARHGVQANNLFGNDIQEMATPTFDLTANSPEKKKTKGIAGATASYKVNNKNDHTPPTNPHSSPILPCH